MHKGLESFFRTGSKAGIQPHHAGKLRLQLTLLDKAIQPEDMNAPGQSHEHQASPSSCAR